MHAEKVMTRIVQMYNSASDLRSHVFVHRIKILGNRRISVAERYCAEPERRFVRIRVF